MNSKENIINELLILGSIHKLIEELEIYIKEMKIKEFELTVKGITDKIFLQNIAKNLINQRNTKLISLTINKNVLDNKQFLKPQKINFKPLMENNYEFYSKKFTYQDIADLFCLYNELFEKIYKQELMKIMLLEGDKNE